MPMLDVQTQAAKHGRIRTGISVIKNGKQRPEKLTRFLITTESRTIADAVAATYGGKVEPFHPMGATQQRGWQVLIEDEEIPVAVPPGQQVVSQWWEMWTAGGLQRRCDGVTASVWEGTKDNPKDEQRVPCKCPKDLMDRSAAASQRTPAACKPSTRLSVILPDIPGSGTFMTESHGLYAAQELAGVASVMAKASAAGVILPAILRLEQREGVRRPGQVTNKFAVPVLQLQNSLRELESIAGQGPGVSQLPPPPRRMLTAGPSTTERATPPAALGAGAAADPAPPRGAAADTAQQDLAPDGPHMSSQQLADKALGARSAAVVKALGKSAAELDLMDDMVDDGTGVLSPLGDVLAGRLAEIEASA